MTIHSTASIVCTLPVLLLISGPAVGESLSVEGTTERSLESSDAAGGETGAAGAPAPEVDGPQGDPAGDAQGQAGDAAGASVASKPDEQSVNIKLRDIEERVNELKEKIFQSKARLMQLQEVVLHGAVSGAKAIIIHRNEMGSSFRLARVQYALDGAPIFNRVDTGTGELDEQEEIELFNGSIAPGNHQLSVYLEYRGHGFGLFSYLKGYKFKIKSSYTLSAEEGKLTTIRVVGHEKGGITADLKDRPSVRYDIESTRALRPKAAGAEGGGDEQAGAAGEGD